MLQIYVDADACPVKSEVERVAQRHRVNVYVVSNGGIRPSANPLVTTVVVDQGLDVADAWIVDHVNQHDVVITNDIPLAAQVIEKGALCIKPNGEVITDRNIGSILAARNLMTDLRSADPFFQSKGAAFSKADRTRFLDALERELRRATS